MPKKRKPARKVAETLRVAAFSPDVIRARTVRVGSLLVVQGAEVDVGRQVLCDHPIVIGRDDRVDLSLNDGSISRAHCSVELDPEGGRYLLVDLGSTNGTSVNGDRVNDRVALEPGDKIFLGASVLRFSLSDDVDLQYHSKLEELVSTDPLTGLNTKRQYDAIFQVLAESALAESSQLTVFAMDMDGLKLINDTYGHEMGSYSIAEMAKLIDEVLGDDGHMARFGGDEFVGCFADLDNDRAVELAERLIARVNDHSFIREGTRVTPTLSIGIATFPKDCDDPNVLFKLADKALYEAKRAGKNRLALVAG